LRRALASDGPALIRVPIAAEHHVLPMVAPGASNIEALDHSETEDWPQKSTKGTKREEA
jgi:thiamine pyrophosphate-dependent acetolactate synthase large subunit-like protein